MNSSSILTFMGLRPLLAGLALCLMALAQTAAQQRSASTAGKLTEAEIHQEAGRRIDSLKMAFSILAERTLVAAYPEEVGELRRKWRAILPEAEEKGIDHSRRLPLAITADSLVVAARSLVDRHRELNARFDEVFPATVVEVAGWQLAQLRAGRRGGSSGPRNDRNDPTIMELENLIGNPRQLQLLTRMVRRLLFPAIVLDSTARESGSTEYLIRAINDLPDDGSRYDSLSMVVTRGMVRLQEEYWEPRFARYAERINAVLSPADRARLDTLRFRIAPLIDIGEEEGEASPIIIAVRKIAARNRRKLNALRDTVLRDITAFNKSYPEQIAAMILQLHDTMDEKIIDRMNHRVVREIAYQGKEANLSQPREHYIENIEPAIMLLPPDKLLRSGVLSPLTRMINIMEGKE